MLNTPMERQSESQKDASILSGRINHPDPSTLTLPPPPRPPLKSDT